MSNYLGDLFYSIHHTQHGVVCKGSIPVSRLVEIGEHARKEGFDLISIEMAKALDATIVLTNQAALDKWRAERCE